MDNLKFRPVKWLHFINEAHPIFPSITFSFLHFTAFYLFTQSYLEMSTFSWTTFILGSLTFSSIILVLRAFDELKDQAVDILHFPRKPLVTGVVARQDLLTLAFTVFAAVLVANLVIILQIQKTI